MFVAVIVCGVAADGAAQNIRPSRPIEVCLEAAQQSNRTKLVTNCSHREHPGWLRRLPGAAELRWTSRSCPGVTGGYSALADLGSREFVRSNGSCVID